MTENVIELIRIPAERVKILVGKEGKTKKRIEQKCKVKLTIDSEGDVHIDGETTEIFFALDVVKAIGRGFEPGDALRLLKDDYGLYVISLKEIAKSDKTMKRLKGRVIGENGKIKTEIEKATDSKLCIYGHTISIIAKIDTIEYAKEAIGMLLNGAKHSRVLSYLAKTKRGVMQDRLRG
jgi:ribosomal RNA assembly protein